MNKIIGLNEQYNINQYKKEYEFSCYIRVERNSIELKFRNFQSSNLNKLIIVFDKTSNPLLCVLNLKNEIVFKYPLSFIIKVYNKLIDKGMMSIVFDVQSESHVVYISKASKEILDHFYLKLQSYIINKGKQRKEEEKKEITIQMENETRKSNELNQKSNFHMGNIKKLNNIMKNYTKNISTLTNNTKINNKISNISNISSIESVTNKKNLNSISYLNEYPIISNFILIYLDKDSLSKLCFLNKSFKLMYDSYISHIKFRNDTPSSMYSRILKRHNNLKEVIFGKGVFLKNDSFKYMEFSLRTLTSIDFSEVTSLNEKTIIRLLNKTSKDLLFISINQYCPYILNLLRYINSVKDLDEIRIKGGNLQLSFEKFLEELNKNNIQYKSDTLPNGNKPILNYYINKEIYSLIIKMRHLRKIHVDLFSLSLIELDLKVDFFSTRRMVFRIENSLIKNFDLSLLNSLSFEYLHITKIKQISFLSSAVNLKYLRIGEFIKCDYLEKKEENENEKYSKDYRIVSFTDSNYNDYHQKNENYIDFDNDYIDIFNTLLFKFQRLEEISFGSFTNDIILKTISLYCKRLTSVHVSSRNITDNGVLNFVVSLDFLVSLDLIGSDYLTGACFVNEEIVNMNSNGKFKLERVLVSLDTYNYNQVNRFLSKFNVYVGNYNS